MTKMERDCDKGLAAFHEEAVSGMMCDAVELASLRTRLAELEDNASTQAYVLNEAEHRNAKLASRLAASERAASATLARLTEANARAEAAEAELERYKAEVTRQRGIIRSLDEANVAIENDQLHLRAEAAEAQLAQAREVLRERFGPQADLILRLKQGDER